MNLAVEARSGVLPNISQAMETLKKEEIGVGWIEKELNRLSGKAESLAAKAVDESVAKDIQGLRKTLTGLGERVNKTVYLTEKALKETVEKEIVDYTQNVSKTRQEIAPTLGLDPDKVLREKDLDPTEALAIASERSAQARKLLSQGENEKAEEVLKEADKIADEADTVVRATQEAFKAHEATVQDRRTETGRIEGLIPEAEAALERIQEKFAKTVLPLGAGDVTHPNANGTVQDNIIEAKEYLTEAKEKLEKAVGQFRAGKILFAAELLRQIKAHQEFMLHRLGEVTGKEERLHKTIEMNGKLLEGLDESIKEYRKTIVGDRRTTRPTLEAFEKVVAQVEAGRKLYEQKKGDPFKTEEALLAAKAALDQVSQVMARNDRDLYEEAERSVKAAERQMEAAVQQVNKASKDNVADSADIERSYTQVDGLQKRLEKAGKYLVSQDHGDWGWLDGEADAIASEAAKVTSVLKQELEEAQSALEAISNAASKVRAATNWSGSYGVYISGSPGSDILERARGLLGQGKYEEAEKEAQRARKKAVDAIEEAESEEQRLREAERRRQEAERRRREEEEEARRRRYDDDHRGGGGWGGSGSGGGGGGFGGSGSGGGGGKW